MSSLSLIALETRLSFTRIPFPGPFSILLVMLDLPKQCPGQPVVRRELWLRDERPYFRLVPDSVDRQPADVSVVG